MIRQIRPALSSCMVKMKIEKTCSSPGKHSFAWTWIYKVETRPDSLVAADNFTSTAYINYQGRTKSLTGLGLSANPCNFCHSNNGFPIVVHIPGNVDLTADALSQKIINCNDLRMHPEVFQCLYILWGL